MTTLIAYKSVIFRFRNVFWFFILMWDGVFFFLSSGYKKVYLHCVIAPHPPLKSCSMWDELGLSAFHLYILIKDKVTLKLILPLLSSLWGIL